MAQSTHPALTPIEYTDLFGWQDDDHRAAFEAFCVSARRMVDTPYKTRALGIDAGALAIVANEALLNTDLSDTAARQFFETHFQPFAVSSDTETGRGFVTGYFEPQVKASRSHSAAFPVPLLRKPPELVEIDDTDRPASLDPSYRFARKTESGFEEFFDRGAIQSGALSGRGLELVWLPSKTDAFFVHIQGSARLLLDNDETMRVTYAAKSGHPYTSLGKVLCGRLNVPQSQMTADRLRSWMEENPDQLDELLALNRSYIFFEEVLGLESKSGPVAAAKVPLVTGRSLAVDRTLHTFGSPVWVATDEPLPGTDKPCHRLYIAHDTGSAIVGAARGDLFIGTGDEAGQVAGKIQHSADLIVLVPRDRQEQS